MNPYHGYDDPLRRAQAEAGDRQKDAMLEAFGEQVLSLAAVLEPEGKRIRMRRLMEEWMPALGRVGVDREHLESVLRKIRKENSNDIGRLAKATIDLYYQESDKSGLAETAAVQRGSWSKAMRRKGATLGGSLSESVLPSWSVKERHRREENEAEEVELDSDANKLGTDDLKDEEDSEWMTVFVKNRL